MASNNKHTIAFLGATGGSANAALYYALQAGHRCIALVRTPQRLREQLVAQKLDESILINQLTIRQGNALDVSAVKSTLLQGDNNTLVSMIVSGLGSYPTFNWTFNPWNLVTMEQPDICTRGARTLLQAMQEILSEQAALKQQKPHLIFVSNTGNSRGPQDVPFWLRWFYSYVLAVPHEDKRAMEELYRGNHEAGGEERVFETVTGVRPTLLIGGVDVHAAAGLATVRAGTEDKPAVGYLINRADVGQWMYENLIKEGDASKRWRNEMPSLTS